MTQPLPMGSVKPVDEEVDPLLAWRKKVAGRNNELQTAQQGNQVSPLQESPSANSDQFSARRQSTLQVGQNAVAAGADVAQQKIAKQQAIRQKKYQEQLAYSQKVAAQKQSYALKEQQWKAQKDSWAQQRAYQDYMNNLQTWSSGSSSAPQVTGTGGAAQYASSGAWGNAGLGGEQETNAQAIANVALQRGLGRDGVIAGIMTALTESSLTNVGHGDAMGPSSRGLFQQMPKYWGPEATIMDPAGAAGLFFDKWVNTSGDPWKRAQAVQQSEFTDGSNYQKNYQRAVQIADALLKPRAQGLVPVQSQAPYTTTTRDGQLRQAIVQNAQHAIGLPYVWGGASLSTGADCSGLVEALYSQLKIPVPEAYGSGGGRAQAQVTGLTSAKSGVRGTRTNIASLQPGDLVAWQGGWAGDQYVGHIAVYAGNNQIIESPDVGMTVRQRSLRSNEMGRAFGIHLAFG